MPEKTPTEFSCQSNMTVQQIAGSQLDTDRSRTNGRSYGEHPSGRRRSSGSPRSRHTPRRRTRISKKFVRFLTIANLGALTVVWYLLFQVSETWWLSTALTYLPRLPYAFPAFVLLAGSILWDRRTVVLNIVAIAIALGPIAEYKIPVSSMLAGSPTSTPGPPLKVVSCNIQQFRPDFTTVLRELASEAPDVVAFQECQGLHPLLDQFFDGWHCAHVSEFWIGSKYPVREIGRCTSAAFKRTTALAVEIDTPDGTFQLINLHLMTARHGLRGLNLRSLVSDLDAGEAERSTALRDAEAAQTRTFAFDLQSDMPQIVVGDFNVPSSSSMYRRYWNGLTNAFDVRGIGYGYSAPCSPHRFWLDGVPWIRVDHVLTSTDWSVNECHIGRRNGSDHRLIAASLSLKTTPHD